MAMKIFISYRRDDARADARHLQDRLQARFGGRNVFMDIGSLRPGQRFDQQLDAALSECNVLLAVIGPRWVELLVRQLELSAQDPDHRDFVRDEIAEALRRGIVVIPVTVDGAPLPTRSELPEDLRDLAWHQAHDLTHHKFGRDVDELVEAIREALSKLAQNRRPWALIVSFLLVLVAATGAYVHIKGFFDVNNLASILSLTNSRTTQDVPTRAKEEVSKSRFEPQKDRDQLDTAGTAEGGDSRKTHLHDAVYKITILHDFYSGWKPVEVYVATGVLAREPNFIVTSHLRDREGKGIYEQLLLLERYLNKGTPKAWLCRSQPDSARLKHQQAAIEEQAEQKETQEEYRRVYQAISENSGDRPIKAISSEQIEGIIKNWAYRAAEEASCHRFEIKKIDVHKRLVLLETRDKLDGSVRWSNLNGPPVGEAVMAYGFPIDAESFATRRSTASDRSSSQIIPTITSGSVVKINTDNKDGEVVVHQVPLPNGNFGGPLVNGCNEIIGINLQPANEEALQTVNNRGVSSVSVKSPLMVNQAISAREVLSFLELNGINVPKLNIQAEVCDAAMAFDSKNNPFTFIVAIAVLLLTFICVIALRRHRLLDQSDKR